MKKFIALLAVSFVGCASQPMLWDKEGSTASEFNTAKLACLQQSQQQYGTAYVNPTVGVANSGMTTNGTIFNTCMNSNGWTLMPKAQADANNARRSQQISEFKTASARIGAEATAHCSAAEYAAFFKHAPCKPKDATLDQLSDQDRVTSAEERTMVSKLAKFSNDSTLELIPLLRKDPGRGRELAALYESTNSQTQENAQALYQAKITWGEYNARRKKASEEFGSSWSRITGN